MFSGWLLFAIGGVSAVDLWLRRVVCWFTCACGLCSIWVGVLGIVDGRFWVYDLVLQVGVFWVISLFCVVACCSLWRLCGWCSWPVLVVSVGANCGGFGGFVLGFVVLTFRVLCLRVA